MLKVGITGGIGTGKTTVCRIFELLDVPHYNADQRSKILLATHPEIREKVSALFGSDVYSNNTVDRVKIAGIVFKDQSKLKALENILHPAVKADFLEWVEIQTADYIIKEAALLYEAGSYKLLDKIIVVSSPEVLRIKRVMKRDQISAEEIKNRISKQYPQEEKEARADYILKNDDKELLMPQVLRLHQTLLKLSKDY